METAKRKFSVYYKFSEGTNKWHLWGIYSRKGYASRVAQDLAKNNRFQTRVMSSGIIYETHGV